LDALSAAAKLLASRPRSRAALIKLLEAKGYSPEDSAAAANRCVELGYLREADVARAWARELLAAGHAPDSVIARLEAKELDAATARAAVDAEVAESGWDAAAQAQKLMKKRKLTGAKAVRFLLSRGFEEEVARKAAGFDEM
jgi:SOS response regulatory protein OraA/RecX